MAIDLALFSCSSVASLGEAHLTELECDDPNTGTGRGGARADATAAARAGLATHGYLLLYPTSHCPPHAADELGAAPVPVPVPVPAPVPLSAGSTSTGTLPTCDATPSSSSSSTPVSITEAVPLRAACSVLGDNRAALSTCASDVAGMGIQDAAAPVFVLTSPPPLPPPPLPPPLSTVQPPLPFEDVVASTFGAMATFFHAANQASLRAVTRRAPWCARTRHLLAHSLASAALLHHVCTIPSHQQAQQRSQLLCQCLTVVVALLATGLCCCCLCHVGSGCSDARLFTHGH